MADMLNTQMAKMHEQHDIAEMPKEYIIASDIIVQWFGYGSLYQCSWCVLCLSWYGTSTLSS